MIARSSLLSLALVPLAFAGSSDALASSPVHQKPRLKPTVPLAKSWEAAVSEARMLKLPLVVHIHGFY